MVGSVSREIPQSSVAIGNSTQTDRWNINRFGPTRTQLVKEKQGKKSADDRRDHNDVAAGGGPSGERPQFNLAILDQWGRVGLFAGPCHQYGYGRDIREPEEGEETDPLHLDVVLIDPDAIEEPDRRRLRCGQ